MYSPISIQLTLILTVTCIVSVYSITAGIEPVDPIKTQGSNITLTCTLTNPNDPYTSADIVWYYRSSRTPVPNTKYHVVNSTSSALVLNDLSMDDSGTYLCALFSDGRNLLQYEGSALYVGLPASPPGGLVCHSDNILDYWCEWYEGTPSSNLRTRYTLQFRQLFGGQWQECPDYESRGPNTCFISRDFNSGYAEKIRVTATNALGMAKAEINFKPELETIPNPPSNVSVESRGKHSLQVTWIMPAKWTETFYMYLDYRLQYSSEFDAENWIDVSSREIFNMRRRNRYIIKDLDPFTRYNVRMSCKSMGIMDDLHWSEWTSVQVGMTDSAVPTAAVTAVDWREYSSHEEPLFKRDVFVEWKKLHRHQKRGKITGYTVKVIQQLEGGEEVNVFTKNATSTVVFVLGLEKFQDYYVQISACNIAGCGPNATIYLPDGTSEPGAPKNVVAHWESLNEAKITWEIPGAPNGYVLGYYVQWAANNKDAQWSSVEVQSNETTYVIKNLDQETTYQFRVQTENARGHSGWTYSYDLPDEETLALSSDQTISRSAQQILKQAAQSLKDMMSLLKRTTKVEEDTSNEVLI